MSFILIAPVFEYSVVIFCCRAKGKLLEGTNVHVLVLLLF